MWHRDEIGHDEYEDGPWATGKSASYFDEHRHDNERAGWAYDDREGWGYHKEAVGVWHFSAPEYETEEGVMVETKGYIQVEACEQGFLIMWDGDALAFTDRMDAVEWLLGWLGFEDEMVESVLDILWDADELYNILSDCVAGIDYDELGDIDCPGVLAVARAARAYIDSDFVTGPHYRELAEAVKKWQGIEGGEELHLPIEGTILTDIQQADAMERLDRR